jgi:hypothetical protein
MADGEGEDEAVHTHDCSRCAYVWQCRRSGGSDPEENLCAICEALDHMQKQMAPPKRPRSAAEAESG